LTTHERTSRLETGSINVTVKTSSMCLGKDCRARIEVSGRCIYSAGNGRNGAGKCIDLGWALSLNSMGK